LLIAVTIVVIFIDFTRVSHHWRVSPYTFLPVRARFFSILYKFAHIFFPSGVTPEGCHSRRSAPRPSPSDATAGDDEICNDYRAFKGWHEHLAWLHVFARNENKILWGVNLKNN